MISFFALIEEDRKGGGPLNEIELLYKQYYPDLYRYIFSLTLNHYHAEDIVSSTFFAAINSIHTFKHQSSIKTCLIGIARDEYYSFLKKNPMNLSIDEIGERATSSVSIDNQTEQIIKIMQTFDDPQRQIVILRLINQLSFLEISQIVNQSESYCRVSFFRGKQKLVEVLKHD